MSAFKPTTAAMEGLRLIRREPGAVSVWLILWLAAFLITAVIVSTGQRIVFSEHRAASTVGDIYRHFGPFAAGTMAMFLVVWATTTVAVYRAVLRPAERQFFYLRLGADELRLAIMTVTSFVLVLVFGGAPAYLLLVLADPLMRALPDMAREIAAAGALLTVCVDVWLAVRLSLIAVETFAERRFHLTAYWPLAHGRFWYLLSCYFLCFLMVFGLSLFFFFLGETAWAFARPEQGAGTLVRRTELLGLAGLWGVAAAAFSVASSTVFCACQAYAFRVIVEDGKSGVVIG